MTPVHCAASKGHLAVLEWLLFAGAHLYAKTNAGENALHFAAISQHFAVVSGFYLKK
jgi:ankyrin repeat protein